MEKTFFMMDTAVTVKIFGECGENVRWQRAIQAAGDRMAQIDSMANHFSANSLLTRINHEAAIKPVEIPDDMRRMLLIADRIYRLSSGAFNPAIGALTELWGFGDRITMRVPQTDEIMAALKHTDADLIFLQHSTVSFGDSNMRLDLGGLAKGYAVDAAVQTLQNHGITDAQVDAGGDLRAIAGGLTCGRRNVYIRHPQQSDAFFAYFALDSGAVATSGDYERFFIEQDIRYHHILDGKTGYPARHCLSVTIIGDTAAECDALATAVFVLGPQAGLQLIESIAGVEGVIIYRQGKELTFIASSGLAPKLMLMAGRE